MNKQLIFRMCDDHGDCSHAGALLLLAADTAYCDPSESTPEFIHDARVLVDAVLSAARAGGHTQGDILRTLLARNQPTRRVMVMAQAACDAAGDAAVNAAFERAGPR